MANKNNWTREEHIVAFNLYCKVPFTKINANYAPVKELARIIGRSEGAVAMKLANFARFDPTLQARNVSGLSQGAKGEEIVWNEFHGNWEELAWQSEQILANYKKLPLEIVTEISLVDLPSEGKERQALVKLRVNQSFFRKTILASYNTTCCITGISQSQLLVASHIVPWAVDANKRMNPSNGLCLNALHDKAFDAGLMTVTPTFTIKVSEVILSSKNKISDDYFLPFHDKSITLPNKFYPNQEFLDWHNKNIFLE